MKKIRTCAAIVVTSGLLVLCVLGCGRTALDGVCAPGYFECDFLCVDPGSDPQNCGSCGLACHPGEVCSRGRCEEGSTRKENQLMESGNLTSGLSTPLTVEDPPVDECASSDQAGLTSCGGICVNTRTDRSHCGACFATCPSGTFCRTGTCTEVCSPGLTNCDGTCVNLQTREDYCGACNNTCEAGEACSGGVCAHVCQPGLTNCDGTCVNLRADRSNCGACGNECASGEACSQSMCSASCGDGLENCDGTCVDLSTDAEHCGECHSECSETESCINGSCEGQSW